MTHIKKNVFKYLNTFSGCIPVSLLISATQKRLVCPTYHVTSSNEVSHVKHLYQMRNLDAFKKDMDFFLKYYKPITLFELKNIIENNGVVRENSFFLSFDDGLAELFHVVAPVLKEKGIPATIFLNSDFIDNKSLFYRYKASLLIEHVTNQKEKLENRVNEILKEEALFNQNFKKSLLSINYQNKFILDIIAQEINYSFEDFLKNQKPYLTTEQIKTLLENGFTIGAHSKDHPEYRFIPFEEQVSQTVESLSFIKQKFQINYNTFAFPFTDFGVSKRFFDEVYATPNKILDLSFSSAGLKKDIVPNHVQRIPMEGTLVSARKVVASEYLYYLLKLPLGKNKIKRV